MARTRDYLDKAKCVGINVGGLYEVIASTSDLNGRPHAAPMGVLFLSFDSFIMRSYGETVTLRNLRASKRGALNVVDNVELFFDCIFKPGKLSFKWFNGVPVLKGVRAWIVFELEKVIDEGQYYEMHCSIVDAKAVRARPKPICRAEASLLEALIHYTRLRYYTAMGRENEVRRLKELIDHHLSIVERTGWPKLRRIAEDLRRKTSVPSNIS